MAPIICLGSTRWLKQPTRTQRLLMHMDSGVKILYFQPPTAFLSRDPRRNDYKLPGKRVTPNITVYTLPPVLSVTNDEHPRLRDRMNRTMTRYIQEKCSEHKISAPLLWVCSPLYAGLLDTLRTRGVVYDCYQDWGDQFDIQWESKIARDADVLFAASPGLVEHLSPCNVNIALLPNGGDWSLFSRTEDLTMKTPYELEHIRAPIFGYIGTVTRDVDLEPVYTAAKAHAGWSFVFTGKCSSQNPLAGTLRRMPNVHFLGKTDPLDLPPYAAHFDALFDLLETDDPDEDVVPSRIYDYLMVGRPIVAMYPMRFVATFPEVIYGAHTSREFVDACYQAIMENSSWAVTARKDYGRNADWSLRAQEAASILESNGLL